MGNFLQTPPELENPFLAEELFGDYIRTHIPEEYATNLEEELTAFGARVAGPYLDLCLKAEKDLPQLVQYSAWGERIDKINMSPAWDELVKVAAREGLISIGYEKKGEVARLHQFLKMTLFHPSSAFVTCPLAMTDGAAKVLEILQPKGFEPIFERLTTSNELKAWLSGQWMTEKTGGSDVSQTETVAREVDGQWLLSGDKWFTSAAMADVAMALARTEKDIDGSRGLSLFCVHLRDANGKYQNITLHRLKDKLGTKAMPTAELSMRDTPGMLVGKRGEGVKNISTILNMSRIYNSICAISIMARGLQLLRNYSKKRIVFGKRLCDQTLFSKTFANLQSRFAANFVLTFHVVQLLGREESKLATDKEKSILRLLIPITKLFTGKEVVAVTSEVLEGFGGVGYTEDSGLPRLLRDAQVLPIWEGTTDVLSLDTLRVIAKENSFRDTFHFLDETLQQIQGADFIEMKALCEKESHRIQNWFQTEGREPSTLEFYARELAWQTAALAAGTLLLKFASQNTKLLRYKVMTEIFLAEYSGRGLLGGKRFMQLDRKNI